MAGNPPADAHADGGDLPLVSNGALGADPHAREAFYAHAFDAEFAQRADLHLFKVSHVLVHVASIGLQVEDGITDELSWAVISHVSAATRLVNRHALPRKLLIGSNDVSRAMARFHAEGNDGWMFEQQQRVADAPGAPVFNQRRLQIEAGLVVDTAETPNGDFSHDAVGVLES